MKSNLTAGAVALLAISCLVTGCATGVTPAAQTRARIHEKETVFKSLTETQQENIRSGSIEVGDTPDIVYMALGQPARIQTSADGKHAMWVYVEYFSANTVFTTSINTPGAAHNYVTGQTAANAPGSGNSRASTPADFHGTNNITPVQSLDLPDMRSNKIYVFYSEGKVVEIKVDGEGGGQMTVQHPSGKSGLNGAPHNG